MQDSDEEESAWLGSQVEANFTAFEKFLKLYEERLEIAREATAHRERAETKRTA